MILSELKSIIEKSQDKLSMFLNPELILSCDKLTNSDLTELITTFLDDSQKVELLKNEEIILNVLGLKNYNVSNIISSLNNVENKIEMLSKYDLENYNKIGIIRSFPLEQKIQTILNNTYNLKKADLAQIIASLSIDNLINFVNTNKEFLNNNNLSIANITRILDKKSSIELINKLNLISCSQLEKNAILATLNVEAKGKINKDILSDEEKTILDIKIRDVLNKSEDPYNDGLLEVDLNEDIEKFKGLDEYIIINPSSLSKEQLENFHRLCDICPNMLIRDDLELGYSTVEEYKNAELWINNVLGKITDEMTDIQKVAIIDNEIGKKISYSPEYGSEAFKGIDARALWKCISSGYGVCNGIAQIECYLLGKVGIDAKLVSGKHHSFVKLNNITLPREDGSSVTGNTIIDPTWNLTNNRYGSRPQNFCLSYEEIRQHDINSSGMDFECHKNDEELSDCTITLDDKSLRDVYQSIGIIGEDRSFKIKELIDKASQIDNLGLSQEEAVKKQLEALANYMPDFATCQNSTMDILKAISLSQENMSFNRCVVNRVYNKEDEGKKAIVYVFLDIPDCGEKFYIADAETGSFIDTPKEAFIQKYECYEKDRSQNKGVRPWEEVSEPVEEIEDLTQSSGKIGRNDGDGRVL